ncbi:GILT-like protein 1 isoform X1 [Varroa jacobsoni]|uniref:Uncharacterized protein n=1 Tax=Varroa destructor TaxID=109461 RepID=A0A7M7J8K3_VARDE|nr:GILT-like protein 1 isoform X2 [Varroa destructor]XP_022703522.1 GILT-like protein 1 isoform X1 [Varroa jacobsoni]XP_022703523.1 GILT-like protein 1 isoform X1 [Varroa jacobsoni]
MVRRDSIILFVVTVLVLQLTLLFIALQTEFGCSLFGLCTTSSSASLTAAAVTRVEILYETHCPDSQQIMREGVKKSLSLLPEVEFVLVPYGKASTSGEGPSLQFQCQHGVKECEGNTFHACAIKLHQNKKQVIEFVICTMSYRQDVRQNIEQCAAKNSISYEVLHACAKGQQGKDLLAKMGVMTQATAKEINGGSQLDFVPSTLIDGEPFIFEAYNDLYKTICVRAKQKPSRC